jgi:hypothetical protein
MDVQPYGKCQLCTCWLAFLGAGYVLCCDLHAMKGQGCIGLRTELEHLHQIATTLSRLEAQGAYHKRLCACALFCKRLSEQQPCTVHITEAWGACVYGFLLSASGCVCVCVCACDYKHMLLPATGVCASVHKMGSSGRIWVGYASCGVLRCAAGWSFDEAHGYILAHLDLYHGGHVWSSVEQVTSTAFCALSAVSPFLRHLSSCSTLWLLPSGCCHQLMHCSHRLGCYMVAWGRQAFYLLLHLQLATSSCCWPLMLVVEHKRC